MSVILQKQKQKKKSKANIVFFYRDLNKLLIHMSTWMASKTSMVHEYMDG